jgi:hypothetical protein
VVLVMLFCLLAIVMIVMTTLVMMVAYRVELLVMVLGIPAHRSADAKALLCIAFLIQKELLSY